MFDHKECNIDDIKPGDLLIPSKMLATLYKTFVSSTPSSASCQHPIGLVTGVFIVFFVSKVFTNFDQTSSAKILTPFRIIGVLGNGTYGYAYHSRFTKKA
jgi:hypothetical protein